jgi:hypothetical protein
MILSIIFLEDKHKLLLHLSIFYEYQQFCQHRICFSIQPPDYSDPWPTLARSTNFFLIMLFNHRLCTVKIKKTKTKQKKHCLKWYVKRWNVPLTSPTTVLVNFGNYIWITGVFTLLTALTNPLAISCKLCFHWLVYSSPRCQVRLSRSRC